MDDERLIELVRQYEELYNVDNRRYSDNNYKEILWRTIGVELHKTGTECKARWISLRDQLRKQLKKKKLSGSQEGGGGNVRKWRYEEIMSFVIPFMRERDPNSSAALSGLPESVEESNKQLEDISNGTVSEEIGDYNKSRSSPTHINEKHHGKKNLIPPKKFKSKIKATENANSVMMKCILDNQRENANRVKERDNATDTFFHSVSATIKQFSPYYQNIAKSRIFAIVSELEMEQILNKQPVSSQSDQLYHPNSASTSNVVQVLYTDKPAPSPASHTSSTGMQSPASQPSYSSTPGPASSPACPTANYFETFSTDCNT